MAAGSPGRPSPAAVALLAAACAALAAGGAQGAEAERTVLTLDPVPHLVAGEGATFTGSLQTASGRGVAGATVEIRDNDPGFDDLIATAPTGRDGRFEATALVRDWDGWGGASDIYAAFGGGVGLSASRSAEQQARVWPAGSGDPRGPAGEVGRGEAAWPLPSRPAGNEPRPYPTQIRLHAVAAAYAGEAVAFSGTLTANGRPLPGAAVRIMEDASPRDGILASARTDLEGGYRAEWRAPAGLAGGTVSVYAAFGGEGSYLRSRTPGHDLAVLERPGSITLGPLPEGAHAGDHVTLSGTLALRGTGTANAIVHIKDADASGPDDLLATAYADADGRYAVTWVARGVDGDGVADVYAVFEAGSEHHRLSTCDPAPAGAGGGPCRGALQLATWPARPAAPPGPPGTEHVALNYVVPFGGRPTVAISPSPDSHAMAGQHVVPVREGIEALSSGLAAAHGGDWLVDFEVIEPGDWRAGARADIVVNIVTGDGEGGCGEARGPAPPAPEAYPVQVHVCATQGGSLRPAQDVMGSAARAFAHAVGLGHAFSGGGGVTCGAGGAWAACLEAPGGRGASASPLALEAMAALYGSDGYAVPNNAHGRYFAHEASRAAGAAGQGAADGARGHAGGALRLGVMPAAMYSEHAAYARSLDYLGPEVAYINGLLALPRETIVLVSECGAQRGAYDAGSRTIRICYEDVYGYAETARGMGYGEGATHDYVRNNIEFALYRGVGHAIINPSGQGEVARAEEAADSFAAYAMLTYYDDPDVGQDALYDASTQLYVQSRSGDGAAGPRELAAGRFDLLTCYAYGQDPASRAHLAAEGWLPRGMIGACEAMYSRMVALWDAVLEPYLRV